MALRNFDVEKYLKEGAQSYGKREEIENLVDKLSKTDYDNVCFIRYWRNMGRMVSGSRSSQEILQHLPIYLENAGEFLVKK